MTEQKIHNICKVYNISNYKINSDGSIDVDGNVDLTVFNLTKLPLTFNYVSGHFLCSNNYLTSLKGSPRIIGHNFSCTNNNITSLIDGPDTVGRYYYCNNNNLESLIGSPKTNERLECFGNPLKSLDGYKGELDLLFCHNKDILVSKFKRKEKIRLISEL